MASVEFGQRDVANSVRERLDGFLAEDDSRVEKTVKLQDRVPDALVQRVREEAESAKDPALRGDSEAIGFLREEQRFEDELFDVSLRGAAPSGRDYERLEEVHSERSERAQRVDERRSATVTPDPLTWAQNPAQYDYVGIDTVDPEELHAERSLEARSVDERRSAPIADSKEQWAQNTDTYDWPGVDTKQRPTMGELRERTEQMQAANREALGRQDRAAPTPT